MDESELRLECVRLVFKHKTYEAPPETIVKEAEVLFDFIWRKPPQP